MIGNSQEIVKWLFEQDREKQFEIKEHKVKRSLNANAYAWTLIGKIAEVVGNTKEEVYREYIKNKGIYRVITIDNKAAPTFIKLWNDKGLGWICETSETNIAGLVDIIAYYGTSSYNTKQMACFIDYIVQEAKELNIETLTPDEIERLKSMWNVSNSK
jgi:hypothetical protein